MITTLQKPRPLASPCRARAICLGSARVGQGVFARCPGTGVWAFRNVRTQLGIGTDTTALEIIG
jgi:hypothetical protein